MSEKQLEHKMTKWLQTKGIYPAGLEKQKKTKPQRGWYFKVWGGGLQRSGIPDYILCVNGAFVSVETKAKTGKPSRLQEINTSAINQSEGIGIILYPDGLEDFKEMIEELLMVDILDRDVLINYSNPYCQIYEE